MYKRLEIETTFSLLETISLSIAVVKVTEDARMLVEGARDREEDEEGQRREASDCQSN